MMNNVFVRHTPWILAVISLWFAAPLQAADRALLIGVGNYANSAYNLPGIDLDISRMQTLSRQLGYDQLKILRNSEASLATVEKVIREWLIKGTGPNDRALLYFSGHGTRIPDENGDESDNADEVLVMYEAHASGGQIKGVLTDDRLNQLLKQIPARQVMVLIDACHSGSATKDIKLRNLSSGNSEGYSKFLYYSGVPEAGTEEIALAEKGDTYMNYVALSAAFDSEKALATKKGSLFTRSLSVAIDESIARKQDTTLKQVQTRTTDLIAGYVAGNPKMDASRAHHPQLSGNLSLAEKPLQVRKSKHQRGYVWQEGIKLVHEAPNRLQARALSTKLELGDRLQLEVDVPAPGYLNILWVDMDNHLFVIFANGYDRNNRVDGGRLVLPGKRRFDWPILPPFGRNLVMLFYTSFPSDLYKVSDDKRNNKGELLAKFPTISLAATRSAVSDDLIYATAIEVSTCLELSQCK